MICDSTTHIKSRAGNFGRTQVIMDPCSDQTQLLGHAATVVEELVFVRQRLLESYASNQLFRTSARSSTRHNKLLFELRKTKSGLLIL